MYKPSGSEQIIDIESIPLSDSGAPEPSLVAKEGSLTLSYLIPGDTEERVSVTFTRPVIHIFGAPNDETFHSHPLYEKGLKPYAVSEVLNSGWIEELAKANSVLSQHNPDRYKELRHFVFAFHDSTFECVAQDVAVSE